ncbi:hypothetical protein D3W54_12440 [Komagataeibacter medellinensis]|uniref:Uncharacterized protein n=1 Tax=Komagataeibacter medellinensis TaxID=1177712 RepID=A0ABQ6VXD8_9PROT|nr:hypothetical protein D3W54_12440 [Komagataeibacter medellinensis]
MPARGRHYDALDHRRQQSRDQRIIDTYLSRLTEVAVAGMQLWEQHREREISTVVLIAATRDRPESVDTAMSHSALQTICKPCQLFGR